MTVSISSPSSFHMSYVYIQEEDKRWKLLEAGCVCPYSRVHLLQNGICAHMMTVSVLRSIHWQKHAVLKDEAMTWDWAPAAGACGPALLSAVPAVTSPATWPGLTWQRRMTLVPTGKFTGALEETNGERKLYIAGCLKLSSEDFLTCSKVAPCIVFLIRSAGSHFQRKHQCHLVTKHTAVYCLVLLPRRGPGLFTARACDEGDNIN